LTLSGRSATLSLTSARLSYDEDMKDYKALN